MSSDNYRYEEKRRKYKAKGVKNDIKSEQFRVCSPIDREFLEIDILLADMAEIGIVRKKSIYIFDMPVKFYRKRTLISGNQIIC